MAELEIQELKDDNSKSRKWLYIIIAVVALILLLIILFFVYLYISKSGILEKTSSKSKDKDIVETTESIGIGPLFTFDTFIVNLADPSGSRYLRMTMDVEVDNNAVVEEMKTRQPQLRDMVISIASNKTYEDISTTRGKLAIKEEIIRRFNLILKSGKVRNIYFTEFVVQ
jgi:flagellar FliL protein